MYRLWLLFIVADVYFTKIFIPTKELYVMEGVIKMESKPSHVTLVGWC